MTKQEQIEEMQDVINKQWRPDIAAEQLYNAGYRKADEVRKETAEDTAKEFANELKARSFPEDGIGWDCVYVKDIDAVLKEYGVEEEK